MKGKYERIKAENLSDEGCLNLLEAIVGSAADEWRECRLQVVLNPNDKFAREHLKNTERFFLSDYFHELTNLDGRSVLKQLESDWIAERRMQVSAVRRAEGG